MKILVTGGAGFIGSNIVDALIELGHTVVIIDNLSTGKKNFVNSKAKFILEDITSENLIEIFKSEKPEIVFHQAAQIDVQLSIKQPYFDAKINILGTINVLEACVNSGVEKVIYASSAAAFGEPEYLGIDENHPVKPISYYGISKHTPEHYLKVYNQLYGLKYTALRYANVYGIRQDPKGEGGVVSVFIDKVLKGEGPIIHGTGEQTRDFIYVKDIVSANIASIEKGDNYILNIGTGVNTSILDLFNEIKQITSIDLKTSFGEARKGDIFHSYYDISLAESILDWKPKYNLKMGLNETIDYYKGYKLN